MDGAAQNYAEDLDTHIILLITAKTAILSLSINKKNVTFMEYEKKYKEALDRAKEKYSACSEPALLEYIFPELKESEDEQSKNWILEYLYDGLRRTDEQFKDEFKAAIAWLEKQDKPRKTETLMTLDEAIEHCKGKSCDNTLCSKEHKQLAEWLTELKGYRVSVTRETQNPADKLEPKFHEGNWVLNNVCPPVQIASIKGSMYIFTEGDAMPVSFVDENYHLWTIEDAKNGDVLATWSGAFIYNGKRDGISCPGSYCGINTLGRFKIGGGKHWTGKKVYPATKEQRDLLFQKMKEAGYEWDSEKKELKKIEFDSEGLIEDSCQQQADDLTDMVTKKSVWREEDETYLEHCITAITNYYTDDKGKENPFREPILDFLKSIKQRIGGGL